MANSTGEDKVEGAAYDFPFVEVGGPSQGQQGESRSFIRAHVMRDFYDKRRQPPRNPTNQVEMSASLKKDGVSQQTHRFKVGPEGLRELRKKRKKRSSTGAIPGNTRSLADNIAKPAYSQAPPAHGRYIQSTANTDITAPPTLLSNYCYPISSSDGLEVTANETYFQSDDQSQITEQLPSLASPGPFVLDPFNALPLPTCPHRTQLLLYHGM
jgi:hypothetical protein